MILETPFTSVDELFTFHLPKVSKMKRCILRTHWDSTPHIVHVKTPMLFFYAKHDKIVPSEMVKRLIKLTSSAAWVAGTTRCRC